MTIIYTNCNAWLVDGNQLKWKVQYDIIYNNIYTEIVIAMLMFNMPCCYTSDYWHQMTHIRLFTSDYSHQTTHTRLLTSDDSLAKWRHSRMTSYHHWCLCSLHNYRLFPQFSYTVNIPFSVAMIRDVHSVVPSTVYRQCIVPLLYPWLYARHMRICKVCPDLKSVHIVCTVRATNNRYSNVRCI